MENNTLFKPSYLNKLKTIKATCKGRIYFFSKGIVCRTGHISILDHMKLKPVLGLDICLGEGTRSATTMSIADSTVRLFKEMATFEEAGISGKN